MTTANFDHGRTQIEDTVVAKIAGMATREVSGVHSLGSAGRAQGPGLTQGVVVEVGERVATVDVSIVAEYGVAIHELAEVIRHNVISAIEKMTGLSVTKVNITVHDIYLGTVEETAE
ncbi:Asp23/Gls24 family envelope stress response protein [Corynebacterium sp. H130]|uniref:Asp23/Gls24 family envelope stress response protein n=1 Tax=Corynebacterium sp. H130 TaxID=3133444 RepID=UPI0030AA55F6